MQLRLAAAFGSRFDFSRFDLFDSTDRIVFETIEKRKIEKKRYEKKIACKLRSVLVTCHAGAETAAEPTFTLAPQRL